MNTIVKLDELAKESHEILKKVVEVWSHEVVFTWRWWFGVIVTILTWLFWINYHNQESRYRLLTAGFFVMTISISLDAIGVQAGLWSYRYEIIPFIPAYMPYDVALMPVAIMTLIQFKPHISAIKKGVFFGFSTAFIGEPLIVLTDIYKPIDWRFFYSVPIYFAIYLIAHWLTTKKQYEEVKRY